ncbi:MAG: hypothetical protein K5707_03250 [Clostridia bacterium]|nr:hypothetical protein [Clostridia bacterium]
MGLSRFSQYPAAVGHLKQAIKAGRLPHALLIEGDSLSGKEEFARELVKAVLCREDPGEGCGNCSICRRVDHGDYEDLYVVEKGELSVKDKQIADLQADLMAAPSAEGGRNIAVIEGAGTMTARAQNRLLKTLEEPYPGTLILLLTENGEDLLPTIRSRAVRIRLNPTGRQAVREQDRAMMELAEKIITKAVEHAYFSEITTLVDQAATDRESTSALLDAMERLMRDYMTGGGGLVMDRRHAYRAVKYIEETRRNLAFNMNRKNALHALIIKIGG